ncbi:hypothetical protein N8878_08185 [Psychromonas sp.]|nr:hypothetical protein [Psychromonas sp.]
MYASPLYNDSHFHFKISFKWISILFLVLLLSACGGGSDSGSSSTNDPVVEDSTGTGEEGSSETGSGEEGSDETGSGEEGSNETGSGEEGSNEIGSGEEGSNETGSGEEGSNETGLGEEGSNEIGEDNEPVDTDAIIEVASWEYDNQSSLSFDNNGVPTSLVLGSVDLFSNDSPSGFYLVQTDEETDEETETLLSNVSSSGDEITIANADSSISFTLSNKSYGNHVALHLINIKGINGDHTYGLRLYIKANAAIAAYTLDDYVTTNSWRTNKYLNINWPYLWGDARLDGTYGSVVIYNKSAEDDELDAVLAEIWAVQGTLGYMPKPAGQDSWTRTTVLAWVKAWAEKFNIINKVSIGPVDSEDLYNMTEKWVIPSGANRVYMFSTVWRGEYHLYELRNESVDGDAFPNGKSDLLAYSEYLEGKGAHLQLKSLVPHLPRNDATYFSDTFSETRFLSWGAGTLVDAIGTDDTTLQFKPGPDYIWEQETAFVRIDTEMIYTGSIEINAETGIWTLSELTRGYIGTAPHAHSAGDAVVGVSHSYSDFHFANDFEQPDSLAEEVLNPYGELLNEMKVGHLHFDGTLDKEEQPWYLRDYTNYLYSMQEQPVTGSVVGGSIDANFEKMFPMAEQATKAAGYYGIRIGMRLHDMGRGADADKRDFAPNMLDIHFDVSDLILLGARRPDFGAAFSGRSLTTEILDNYGFTDEAFALYKDWIILAPVYDDIDVEYAESFFTRVGVHYRGEDVLVLSKNSDGKYIYTPHRVMGRSSGEDELITIDQEWGANRRTQNIAAGDSLELYNPNDAQEPQVMVYVDEDTTALQDPLITVNGSGTLSVTGDIDPGEYMTFEGGSTVTIFDQDWNVLRTLPATTTGFIVNNGNNTIVTAAGSGSDAPDNLLVQYITLGDEYVLETNKHL